jgi:citrate lyase subunit beta/citryl-CoA lyase
LLFVPADKPNYCEKALQGEADTIVYDLEDSIAESAKERGRQLLIANFPKNYDGSKELCIRINGPRTPFYQGDLSLISKLVPHSIMLPKIESRKEIQELDVFLNSCDTFATRKIEIIGLIETPKGAYKLREVLYSSHRITAVALGAEDLTYELGVEREGPLEKHPLLNHVQVELALVARMHKMQCIGPIERGYAQEKHLSFLEEECKYLRKINLQGKLAIHPSQVPIINNYFDITSEQIEEANQIIELFKEAEKTGSAVITKGNEMQDTPSLRKSLKLVKYAKEHGFE